MKKADLIPAMESGKLMMVCEYRSTIAEKIIYRDKKTGQTMAFTKLTHNVERGPDQIGVDERVPEGKLVDPEEIKRKQPFKKGSSVVVHVDSFLRDKGVYKASGVLEALEV